MGDSSAAGVAEGRACFVHMRGWEEGRVVTVVVAQPAQARGTPG